MTWGAWICLLSPLAGALTITITGHWISRSTAAWISILTTFLVVWGLTTVTEVSPTEISVRFTTGGVPENAVAIDQIDGPGVDLSGGLELRLSERFGVTIGYTLGLMLPRDVTTSAFSPSAAIACNAAQHDIDTPGCAAIRDGRAIPTAAGSYWRFSNQLTLGLAIDLW